MSFWFSCNASWCKNVQISLLENKTKILSVIVMFCIPVRLCVLERDFPPLLYHLARCRCAVTLFPASQEWHHPLRANCMDSQPTQRGLFIDVSGPRPSCIATCLPPSQVCFHSPRPYCKHTHSLNYIPCGWRILYAKERTTCLTSLVPLHRMLTHTREGTDTLEDTGKHVWACWDTQFTLSHLHIYKTYTYMQTQVCIKRLLPA